MEIMANNYRFKNFPQSKSLPFWSWNDKLDKKELEKQIEWMHDKNFGGFFMHARAGLKTEYLSDEWFDCIKSCIKKAREMDMQAWAYDENGWPSGFVGGKLLEDKANLENYLEISYGKSDKNTLVSYKVLDDELVRLDKNAVEDNCLNVYKRTAVSSVDILDKEVVKKFIGLTHEQYKNKLGNDFNSLCGFFTDEPQFCRKAILFPHVIVDEYKKEYNEDVLDGLGLLFINKKGYRKFRYRYWKLCQKLMLENFAKPIFEWCDKNGVKLTGHYIEERNMWTQMLYNAGIMPFYEYEHIPGIDWLCKRFMSVLPIRQLGSACAQLGKKEVLTETYAMTGWDVSPKELKAICEFQYFFGANKTCQHLLPYAEYGERKNDHPTHFTPINPWVNECYGEYNEYFDKLGGILQQGKEFVNVAMLHPMRSAYFEYDKNDSSSVWEIDNALISYSEYLAKNGIGFHYLDETLLAKYGFVNGAKIGCGKCEYAYLIIPKCYTMDKTTEELLRKYIENGGKVLLADNKPTYLEAEEYDYSYLKSTTTFEEIKKCQPYSIDCFYDKVYSSYYNFDGYDCLFILNTDEYSTVEGNIVADGKLIEVDLLNEREKQVDNHFVLAPLESKIIIVEKGEKTKTQSKKIKEIIFPYDRLEVVSSSDNCLLLDYAEYSLDGKEYSMPTNIVGIFDQLLKKQYFGDLYLRFNFNVKDMPKTAKVLSEYENASITLNGHKVSFNGEYYYEKQMKLGDIVPYLKIGDNLLEIKLNFYQDEKVYYALFGEGVTESLRNCLVYNTYLESIRILGDFGVYSNEKCVFAKTKDVVFAQNFYIGKKKDVISEMTMDGYPFFAGKIKFKRSISLKETDVKIKFLGKIHFANVYVNGIKAGEILFNDKIDISKYAVLGENLIEIEIFTGLRNFYGPHHHAVHDEIGMVAAGTFICAGTWQNDSSIYERKSYSLVRCGIFKPYEKDVCRNF